MLTVCGTVFGPVLYFGEMTQLLQSGEMYLGLAVLIALDSWRYDCPL